MKEFNRNSKGYDKSHHILYQKFRSTISRSLCFTNVNKIVAGISGGADSAVLLHFLCEFHKTENGPEVLALHIHHGQRGEESDRDEAAAREIAEREGCAFESVRLENAKQGMSEDQLRQLRQQALEKFAIEKNCQRIVLGHHLDDQAETFLFRLIRGSDLKGLSSMKVFRNPYVRPLLEVSKFEILQEAERCNIPFVTDSSNLSNGPARNYIRNVVMPALESKLDPQVKTHLFDLAESISEIDLYMTAQAAEIIKEVQVEPHVYSVAKLQEVPVALRKKMIYLMYTYIIKDKGLLSRDQVGMIDRWMETTQSPKFLLLPGNIRVDKKQGVLTFSVVES